MRNGARAAVLALLASMAGCWCGDHDDCDEGSESESDRGGDRRHRWGSHDERARWCEDRDGGTAAGGGTTGGGATGDAGGGDGGGSQSGGDGGAAPAADGGVVEPPCDAGVAPR